MNAGIEIYNTSNVLQITEKFRNLQFLGKGTLSAIDSDGITGDYVGFYDEIIAIRCDSAHYAGVYNYCSERGETGDPELTVAGDVGAVVTYYRFGYPQTPTGGNYFEVYDSSGNLVFSDGAKYMKVVGNYSGTSPAASSTSDANRPIVTVNHSSSITTAIVVGDRCKTYMPVGMYGTLFLQTFKFNSASIESKYSLIQNYGSGAIYANTDYNFLVLDVTNL